MTDKHGGVSSLPRFFNVDPERDGNRVVIRLFVGDDNNRGLPEIEILLRENKNTGVLRTDTNGRAEYEFTLAPGEHRHLEIELAAFGGEKTWKETFRGRRL